MAIQVITYWFCPNHRERYLEFDDVAGTIANPLQDDFIDAGEPCVNVGGEIYNDGTWQLTAISSLPYAEVTNIVTPPPDPHVITGVITNVTANGGSDGEIDVTVTDGYGPFTYLWDDGPTTEDRAGLSAGSYTVAVTDNGKVKYKTFIVAEPDALEASYVQTNVTTNGGSDGTITVTVEGGSGNYNTTWLDGPTTQNRSGLSAGVYSVVIADQNTGEVLQLNITITEPGTEPPPPEEVLGTILEAPMLNSLHFVKESTIDFCDNPQTLDNVLLCNQYHPGYKSTNYFQKVAKCDLIIAQINSDFENHTVQLFDYETDELVKAFSILLKESNIATTEQYNITVRTHGAGQSRVYFNAGTLPLPLEIGNTFEVLNNLDGFDGDYAIVDILTDTTLGVQYLVINLTYDAVASSSSAVGEFTVSTTDFNVYESAMDFLDVADGIYYVKIVGYSDNSETLISEPIDLKVEHPKTNLIVYTNQDNAFDITWTTGYIGRIRVPSILFKRLPQGDRTTSRNSDFSLVKVSARKQRVLEFQTFMLPPYLHEKLSVIFDLDNWSINGVEYQSSEDYNEPEYLDRFYLANSSIKIEQVGWFRKYNSNNIGTVNDGGFIATETGFLKR